MSRINKRYEEKIYVIRTQPYTYFTRYRIKNEISVPVAFAKARLHIMQERNLLASTVS